MFSYKTTYKKEATLDSPPVSPLKTNLLLYTLNLESTYLCQMMRLHHSESNLILSFSNNCDITS
jgi:hypothetical protein